MEGYTLKSYTMEDIVVERHDFSEEIEHIQKIIDSAVDEEVIEVAELYELLDQMKLASETKEETKEDE